MFKAHFITKAGTRVDMRGPTSWPELNVATFQRLHKEWTDRTDLVRMLSIMYNVDYDILNSAPPELLHPLAQACRFMIMEPIELKTLPMPDTIEGLRVPKTIGDQAFGKAIILKGMIGQPFEENIAKLASIWMAPIPFSITKAREIEIQLLMLPIQQVYPISFFCSSTLTLPGSVLMKGLHLLRMLGRKIESTLVNLPTLASSTPTSTSSQLMLRSLDSIQILSTLRKRLTPSLISLSNLKTDESTITDTEN